MPKYTVNLTETTYYEVLSIDAPSEDKAEAMVRKQYESGELGTGADTDLKFSTEKEQPCPDDDAYPCEQCGEETGNGYDNGICCQCLGE
jgi:hypothetical protein